MKDFHNQTTFANQEPVLEDASLPAEPAMFDKQVEQSESLKSRRNKKILILVGSILGVLIMIIGVVLVLFASNGSQDAPENQTIQVPKSEPVSASKTERELQVLKNRLDEIDPTREYITVPPVNYELRLE